MTYLADSSNGGGDAGGTAGPSAGHRPGAPVVPAWPARVSGGLFAGVALFQVGLAAGASWGRWAWGGVHEGSLPTGLRAASAGSALAFTGLAWALAGGRFTPAVRRRVTGAALGLSVVSAALNAISPSAPERWAWTPFALTQIGLLYAARAREPQR